MGRPAKKGIWRISTRKFESKAANIRNSSGQICSKLISSFYFYFFYNFCPSAGSGPTNFYKNRYGWLFDMCFSLHCLQNWPFEESNSKFNTVSVENFSFAKARRKNYESFFFVETQAISIAERRKNKQRVSESRFIYFGPFVCSQRFYVY